MNDTEVIRALCRTYFKGEASPAQEKELFALICSDKENRIIFRQEEQEWVDSSIPGPERREMLERLFESMENRKNGMNGGRISRLTVALASVCALLAIGLCLCLHALHASGPEGGFVAASSKTGASEISLCDGSKVLLCSDAVFSCSNSFSPDSRVINFSGSGFFDIATDADHPFIINMDGGSLSVTGTKFSIDSGKDCIIATLIDGIIDFRSGDLVHRVLPGESFTFNKKDGAFGTRHIDRDSYLALMEGRIEYYNVTLSELAELLEGLYGKHITLDDNLASSKATVSMHLSNRETFEDVIDGLKLMVPISVRQEGDKIWLYQQ